MPYNGGGLPTYGINNTIFALTFNDSSYYSSSNDSTWDSPTCPAGDGGAVWINTGSGPTMLSYAVNAELLVYDPYADWGPSGSGTDGLYAAGWVPEVLLLNNPTGVTAPPGMVGSGSSSGDFSATEPGVFLRRD